MLLDPPILERAIEAFFKLSRHLSHEYAAAVSMECASKLPSEEDWSAAERSHEPKQIGAQCKIRILATLWIPSIRQCTKAHQLLARLTGISDLEPTARI